MSFNEYTVYTRTVTVSSTCISNNKSVVHETEQREECEQCAIAMWRAGPEAAQGVGRGARVRAKLRPTQALRRRHQLPRAPLPLPLSTAPLPRVRARAHCTRTLVVHWLFFSVR